MTRAVTWKREIAGLGPGMIVVVTAACANNQLTPSASVTTLVTGWEQKFTIEWTAEPEQGATKRIRGYIYSQYGQSAEPVRVLAQARDQSGAIIGQRIAWVPGGVPGLGRAYFEVRHMPTADRYTVRIWEYSLRGR